MGSKSVYLSGAINGLSYDEATDWREYVASKLPSHIEPIDPMRYKTYLKDELNINSQIPKKHTLSTPRAIITRDRFDCTRASVVLVNLIGTRKVSIGTVMEIAWADLERIPIVIVREAEGNLHDHCMVNEAAGFIVNTLDEGIEIVKAILTP